MIRLRTAPVKIAVFGVGPGPGDLGFFDDVHVRVRPVGPGPDISQQALAVQLPLVADPGRGAHGAVILDARRQVDQARGVLEALLLPDRLEHLPVQIGGVHLGILDVDEGRRPRDRHLLLELADLENDIDGDGLADKDLDPFPLDGREPRERNFDRVDAAGQGREPEPALRRGELGLNSPDEVGREHLDLSPGKRAALFVDDLSLDGSRRPALGIGDPGNETENEKSGQQ